MRHRLHRRLPPLALRQGPRLVAGALALGLAGCGSSASTTPTATASASPSSAAAVNMALLAHLDLTALNQAGSGQARDVEEAGSATTTSTTAAVSGAGNWGYTTAGGRRFALTGISTGLSIVEVTDPAKPRNVALIAGPDSQWREVRTYGNHVYVTTEAAWGLDIVSMEDPDHPRKVQTWSKTFRSAHSLWIDQERGLLFANGTNGRAGGMRVLDVGQDPEDPAEVGAFTDYYVHDSYTRGNVLFASAINDGFEAILDDSDPSRIHEVTHWLTGGRFTHNSWLTRDGRYLFTTDERMGMPIEGWDITNPLSPRKVSQFIADPNSIAHNVLIDGDRLLLSHYTEGVYLLDVKNPEQPRVMGSYDTYLGPSGGFNGVWGAYIFPASNLIVASDISGGLFVIAYTGP